jgi:predicted nucleotidyltransferase component of viral defense system
MADTPKNMAASVRQRLKNLSIERRRDFGLLLVNYGLERLIYRLAASPYRDRFVLKGGMLVAIWATNDDRTTRDADFLGFGELEEPQLKSMFAEILSRDTDDGLVFDSDNLTASTIREDQVYGGVRIKTIALLGNAKIPITIDIGLGDALTEPDHRIDYPSLLDQPIANVRAYPPETVIAEKFQAIVALGIANGRLKDYYDLWAIPLALTVKPAPLDAAIAATFARRDTAIPTLAPPGLSRLFADDPQKIAQWATYANSIGLDPIPLGEVVAAIWTFLGPSCERIHAGR